MASRSPAPLPRWALLVLAGLGSGNVIAAGDERMPALEAALARAGENRKEIETALEMAPAGQRAGLEFLVLNMPEPDLRALGHELLIEHSALAHEARAGAPWAASVPEDVFLNDVLPYAVLNERRERWRPVLRERCLPLVASARTASEAAQILNREIFPRFKVRYSTQRRRADQGPLETLESGLASCTGLSILLVDACRSVGVPARVAGVPRWARKEGNHTWVEVWDGGWHFTGAAEQDPAGLDRGWFQGDAAAAIEGSRLHAIYASSFRKTGTSFPLPWAPGIDWVSAVDVTRRYLPAAPVPSGRERLLVRVLDRPGGKRVAVPVEVADLEENGKVLEGTSRGESSDTNDILPFELPPGRRYEVRVRGSGPPVRKEHTSGTGRDALITMVLNGEALPPPAREAILEASRRFLAAGDGEQARVSIDPALDRLLPEHGEEVRALAWSAYRESPRHEELRRDFKEKVVRQGGNTSPYTVRAVGSRPESGWPLMIALHGGGGAPKAVNDQQWEVMGRYYRDQLPAAGSGVETATSSYPSGYLYLALRAPNDTWNGFYADYVYPLVETLIRQFLVAGDVDPGRVYVMGYSHGGYGTFAIAPKMPDRFAAAHSSAAAPTDGETSARTLRSLPFSFMVGENDHAYGRVERCRAFDESIRKLRGDRDDIYPVTFELKAGHGHGGLPDRDKIRDLLPHARNPAPREVAWEMTDGVIRSFYWLAVPGAGKGRLVEASCSGNEIVIQARKVGRLLVRMDGRLVDLSRPVTFRAGSRTVVREPRPRLRTLLRTLAERGDPGLAFPWEEELELDEGEQAF